MMKIKHVNIVLVVFTLMVSNAVWSAQEWEVYGCRMFLPDDTPQQTASKAFTSLNVTGDNAFISELKKKGCYSKEKQVRFIGYAQKNNSQMVKYEGEVKLKCREKYHLRRERSGSLQLKERPPCFDCERYFHLSEEYLVERRVGVFEYSETARIYKVDDFVVKASGSYPWYQDFNELVKSLSRNNRSCYLACVSHFIIEVNRATLEVRKETFDENDKMISLETFSCGLYEKKI